MKHLDDIALVDAVEGRGAAANGAHLEACPDCRAKVDELRTVLRQVTDLEVPAPSPLFWDQFPERVSRAIADGEPARSTSVAGLGFRWLSAAAAAITIGLVALTVRSTPPPADARAGTPSIVSALEAPDDIDGDEAWALVRSIADDLDYESAREAGVAPAPGSVERAALELSATEQTALVQLIEQEMKRTDS